MLPIPTNTRTTKHSGDHKVLFWSFVGVWLLVTLSLIWLLSFVRERLILTVQKEDHVLSTSVYCVWWRQNQRKDGQKEGKESQRETERGEKGEWNTVVNMQSFCLWFCSILIFFLTQEWVPQVEHDGLSVLWPCQPESVEADPKGRRGLLGRT